MNMTFTNENPIRPKESENEKVFSLNDIPENVIAKANAKLDYFNRRNPGLNSHKRGKIIKMMNMTSIYFDKFGPHRA